VVRNIEILNSKNKVVVMKRFAADEYIIQLKNDALYTNSDQIYKYSFTNLPKEAFSLKSNTDIFWKIKVTKYDANYGHLFVEVINYHEPYNNAFVFQEFNFKVNHLIFEKIDWTEFEPQLSSYTLSHLTPFLKNVDGAIKSFTETFGSYVEEKLENVTLNITQPRSEPSWEDFTHQVSVPFDKAQFFDSRISFDAFIQGQTIQISIENNFLKQEFDFIKKWFIKKFKSSSFSVTIHGKRRGKQINGISASSPEIAAIDQRFIEEFQPVYIKEYILKVDPSSEKKIIKVSDLGSETSLAESIFSEGIDAETLLKKIFSLNKVRNQKELEFLSSHPLIEADKIIFTTAPQIGFVFTFSNNTNQYFIWELLDSHATYTWKFSKQAVESEVMDILNTDITLIGENGRQRFKQWIKQEKKAYRFKDIYHHLEDLPKWKVEVENLLLE
jgi:hypothetical protein